MAGIGVEFKALQKKRSVFNYVRVIGYALALSAGPWLATTAAVGLISAVHLRRGGTAGDLNLFTSLIMYIFAGSLILTSPFFMLISRYLADERHRERPDQRKAAKFSQIFLFPFALIIGIVGIAYFIPQSLGNSLLTQGMSLLLFVCLCESWILLAYLDMEKRYASLLYAFFLGTVAAIIAAVLLRPIGWPESAVTGYAIGYFLAYLFLLFSALKAPEKKQEVETFKPARLLSYFNSLAILGVIGFFYNLGVWIDKFVVWLMAGRLVPGSRMLVFNPYDIATFMAYLIMIPAVSYFLMVVETDFYDDYREYVSSLESAPLDGIEWKRNQMVTTLRRHWNNLFEMEVVVLILAVLGGTFALTKLGLGVETVAIFKRLSLAAFFQALFWINIILLLYFEFRSSALGLSLFFCGSNALFTWFSINAGFPFGWGYVASAFTCTLISWIILRRGLNNLTRHCFYLYSPSSSSPS